MSASISDIKISLCETLNSTYHIKKYLNVAKPFMVYVYATFSKCVSTMRILSYSFRKNNVFILFLLKRLNKTPNPLLSIKCKYLKSYQ